MALVVDTGPLVALLHRSEARHAACASLIGECRERRVIPAPVLVEVEYLCRRGGEERAFHSLLDDVASGGFEVEDLRLEDIERVQRLLESYSDLRVGFVDAAVLAIVERLGEPKLATLDRRHFATMRPRHRASLELLPA